MPDHEVRRLEAARLYGSHALPDAQLDELTRLAAQLCMAPVALLTLIEGDRLMRLSRFGLRTTESALADSFCAWASLQTDLFTVTDAAEDEPFLSAPLLTGEPVWRFYAGMPLVTLDGYVVGALAVLDLEPRELSEGQAGALRTLAAAAMSRLELRRREGQLERARARRVEAEASLRDKDLLLSRAERRNAELLRINGLLIKQNTDRGKDTGALRAANASYDLVARAASEGLWDWDLKANQMHFCTRWKALLGYDKSDLSTRPDEWFSRVHPDDKEATHSEILAHLMGLSSHLQNEHRLRHRDGSYRWVLCRGMAVWDANHEVYRMAGTLTDITRQKEAETQLRHIALHDPLTGLPNQTLLTDKLRRALDRVQYRDDYLLAVLLLDLDRLKAVNDTYGHQTGDQLLAAVAKRLEVSVRPGDIVARLTGDRFAIVLDRLQNMGDAVQAAERILKAMEAPFHLDDGEMFITLSIGIAVSMASYKNPEDILRDASSALNRAKEHGRGRYELYDAGIQASARALLQLENDLRRALARDEFRVHYQPIISLDTWHITGFEALLRWQHPEHGTISPLQFIPVAEESGMIADIGWWVLRQVCRQLREWQGQFPADPPLTISVNLSGQQFEQPDLPERIEAVLTEFGISPRGLRIEITETVLIENTETAAATLSRLKDLGVSVLLDDFGTGYSSLSYLHRFPIDTLKIDRSFVTRLNLPKNFEIVRAIVTLADNLGINVIAEGVESSDQVEQLARMNCLLMQGYLFSRPMDAEAARGLLVETHRRAFEAAAAESHPAS